MAGYQRLDVVVANNTSNDDASEAGLTQGGMLCQSSCVPCMRLGRWRVGYDDVKLILFGECYDWGSSNRGVVGRHYVHS